MDLVMRAHGLTRPEVVAPADALGRFLSEQTVEHERHATKRAARRALAGAAALLFAGGLLAILADSVLSHVGRGPFAEVTGIYLALSGVMSFAGAVAAVAAFLLWRLAPAARGWRIGLDAFTLTALVVIPVAEALPVILFLVGLPLDELIGSLIVGGAFPLLLIAYRRHHRPRAPT